jgi:hypothetical protein
MSEHQFDPLTQICDCGVSAQEVFDGKKRNPCPAQRETMFDDEGRTIALILVGGGLIFRGSGVLRGKLVGLDATGLELLYARLGQL